MRYVSHPFLAISLKSQSQERAYVSESTLLHMAMSTAEEIANGVAEAPSQITSAAGGLLLNTNGRLSREPASRLIATARLAESPW
jgi:nitrogenase subunit NifH